MSRMTSHGVETMLRSWADAQAPVASPALASFMGPLVPLPAFATTAGHLGSAAAQAGISTKVIAGIAAIAVTGAAAAGVNHLRNVSTEQPRPPQSSAPVVPGLGGDDSEAPGAVSSTTAPAPTESEDVEPEATPTTAVSSQAPAPTTQAGTTKDGQTSAAEPAPTRSEAPAPTRSSSPRSEATEAAGEGDGDHSAEPSSSSSDQGSDHEAAPTRTSAPEGTPSAAVDDPTPTTTPPATSTPKPTPSPTRTKGPKAPGMPENDQGHDQR